MHELSVTKGIVNTVLKSLPDDFAGKVTTINLILGAMYDYEEEWLEKYLCKLSEGTPIEGAKLRIKKTDITFKCSECQEIFAPGDKVDVCCPKCESRMVKINTGREFYVDTIEIAN